MVQPEPDRSINFPMLPGPTLATIGAGCTRFDISENLPRSYRYQRDEVDIRMAGRTPFPEDRATASGWALGDIDDVSAEHPLSDRPRSTYHIRTISPRFGSGDRTWGSPVSVKSGL